MLQVRLLGQFDVRAEGKHVLIPRRAGQSLFAFLILTAGTSHRREKLAGLFWPDMLDEAARRNLRQELWRIRKAFSPPPTAGDYFIAEEFSLSFNRTADYWLDVAQLDKSDRDVPSLMSNLSLYRGELLPGFYDEWIALERERVRAAFEAKMSQLLEQLTLAERWPAVQEWGEKWLALGNAPEAAYRALMLACGARGDIAKVAAIYNRCAGYLRDDLGVEPSAETRALYDGLLKGAYAPLRSSRVQPSGTVTFLFSDIEGSTRLLDARPEQYPALLAEHHALMRAALQKWNGSEVSTQGDAFFITFARALDAVQCAAEAQRALATHTWPPGASVRVRMGLHTGEPLIASTGYVGMDVHRAARIGDAGHGGQVLLSQSTRELVLRDLPAGITLRDLGEHRLKDMKHPAAMYQLVIGGLPSDFPPLKSRFSGSEPPAPGEAPFKGLQYFDAADAQWFFGREALTAELVQRVRGPQELTVIIGASGSGKSSLVRAGLIPALKSAVPGTSQHEGVGGHVYVITPTAHPLEALALAFTRVSESVSAPAALLDDLGKDPRSLHLFLRRRQPDSLPLAWDGGQDFLVVDQFEELFTLCRDEFEREAFVDNLLYAISGVQHPCLSVILTLRADFYAHLAQYPELRAEAAKAQEYIGPMTAEELRRAIEEPARRGHWEFEPGLVDLILRDVGDEPGALPLLSHALLETWKRRSGQTMMLKGYAESGGVRGAIAQTAETVYAGLLPEQQAIARNIFVRLTELGEGTEDTRRRVALDELMSHADQAGEVRAVLTWLADARLVTTAEGTAEVAHEAIIREWPLLREWLTQDREGLRMHRHLTEAAHEWELLERDSGALYRGARLAQAREWAEANVRELNVREQAFLEASKRQGASEEAEREAQRRRELDAAQKLAQVETERAEAERNRAEAETQRAEEQHRRAEAETQRAESERNRAEVELRRAHEQAAANHKLRRRALLLVGALVLAGLLAVSSAVLARQSGQNAQTAEAERANADSERQLAFTRELAVSAANNLGVDPERSILLALQAVAVSTANGKPVPLEAEESLHRAVQTSRLEFTLRGHAGPVTGVAYNFDGTRLATAGIDKTARVWDTATGKELLAMVGHAAALRGVAFSSDGARLATASDDKTAKVWDVATGHELLTLAGHSGGVWAVAFSPDGRRLATVSRDNTARVWDAVTGKELLSLPSHPDVLADHIAFSSDGLRLATAGENNTAAVWDATTGHLLLSLAGHTGAIHAVVFSPDGKRMVTASFDRTARIWDAATGRVLLTLFATASVNSVAFNPAGTMLVMCSADGTASIWDAVSGQKVLELDGHAGNVYDVAFSANAQESRVATAGSDSTARVWDVGLSGGREWLNLPGNGALVRGDIVYSRDGTRLATTGADKTARVWDATTGKELLTLVGHTGTLRGIAVSADGSRFATISDDQTAKVWNAAGGQLLFSLPTHAANDLIDHSVAFSPDGTRLATESAGNSVKIWDAVSGQELLTLSGHTDLVHAIAYSPDGKRLATASSDKTGRVWDAITGQSLLTLSGHTDRVYAIAFSFDGKRLATAGQDGTAKIWDAATGQLLITLTGHTGLVFSAEFSPDGDRLATASTDSTVKVWDVTSSNGRAVQPLTLYGHSLGIDRAVFSPDGNRIATAGRDGISRVYALPIEDIVALAKSRVTRSLTIDECQQFLHQDSCPGSP